jgi:hypothetical protein
MIHDAAVLTVAAESDKFLLLSHFFKAIDATALEQFLVPPISLNDAPKSCNARHDAKSFT